MSDRIGRVSSLEQVVGDRGERAASGAAYKVGPVVSEVRPLRALPLPRFLKKEFQEPEVLLAPWLCSQGLVMIFGPRGAGKTHVATEIAFAVASGTQFLGWKADKARKVLYLDGEMPAVMMQKRLRQSKRTLKVRSPESGSTLDNFLIVTPDCQEGLLPDLGTPEGQELIDRIIPSDCELIVVDNLSCWRYSGREDADAWATVSSWALRQRRAGRTVIFVHHSGKRGLHQRGTSKHEDLLDVILRVSPPKGHKATDGALLELHFEKSRHLYGDAVQPLEAKLTKKKGQPQEWRWKPLEHMRERLSQIIELHKSGMKQAEIARKMKVNKSTVSRHVEEAKSKGLL